MPNHHRPEPSDDVGLLRRQLALAWAALLRYGGHATTCTDGHCTCGLEKAYEETGLVAAVYAAAKAAEGRQPEAGRMTLTQGPSELVQALADLQGRLLDAQRTRDAAQAEATRQTELARRLSAEQGKHAARVEKLAQLVEAAYRDGMRDARRRVHSAHTVEFTDSLWSDSQARRDLLSLLPVLESDAKVSGA